MNLVLEQILLIKIIWYVNFHIQKLDYLQSCIEFIQVQIIYIYTQTLLNNYKIFPIIKQ